MIFTVYNNSRIARLYMVVMFILFSLVRSAPVAAEVVETVDYEGYLADSSGAAVNGVVMVLFTIYDNNDGSVPLWSEKLVVDVKDGAYNTTLGRIKPINLNLDNQYFLDAVLIKNNTGYNSNGSRHQKTGAVINKPIKRGSSIASITPVPSGSNNAGFSAKTAVKWDDIINKPDDFNDNKDDDTLKSLACSNGQLLKWNGLFWACGIDEDTDTRLSKKQVLKFVTEAPINLAPGSTVGGHDVESGNSGTAADWGSIVNIPDAFADNKDNDSLIELKCRDGELLKWNIPTDRWLCARDFNTDTRLSAKQVIKYVGSKPVNLAKKSTLNGELISTESHTHSVDWSGINNVPDDFADNRDNDTFSQMVCTGGQLLKWDKASGGWVCAGDNDKMITGDQVKTIITAEPVDFAVGSTVGGRQISTGEHTASLDWKSLENIPAGFKDNTDNDILAGLSCVAGQVAKWDTAFGGWVCGKDGMLSTVKVKTIITEKALNLAAGSTVEGREISTGKHTASLDWKSLENIPEGFQDNTDNDTLSELACIADEVPKWDSDSAGWVCAQDNDNMISSAKVKTIMASTPIALAAGSTVDGREISTGIHTTRVDWSHIDNMPEGFKDNVDDNSKGDISAVLAGPGLKGGGRVGNLSLSIAESGIETGMLMKGSVTAEKIRVADLMKLIQKNDGDKSGIDADLLDGKHLGEVIEAAIFAAELRKPIHSLPAVIDAPGSYYIISDLKSRGSGITVTADDVTIDLMGYSLIGPGKSSGGNNGIVFNARSNVEVRNGTVRNFGGHGIYESSSDLGKNHRVVNVRVLNNGADGIRLLGFAHIVKDSTASGNGKNGIYTGSGTVVSGNVAFRNGASGVASGADFGSSSTVTGNTAYQNGMYGIHTGTSSTVSTNTVYGNKSSGIVVGGGTTVISNTTRSNEGSGIIAGSGSVISSNTSYQNKKFGIKPVENSLIESNTAYQNSVAGGFANIAPCETCTFDINHSPE